MSFDSAIEAFERRTDIVTKPEFLQLSEANRARSFTVARIAELDLIADMGDAVDKVVAEGQTFRDFLDSVDDIMDRRGWTGLEPWHTKLVYDQNLGMAFSAGRFDQSRAAGIEVWRYLPSDSRVPREEHKEHYNKLFPLGQGPMPPLDFGCNCGWESVFEGEYDPADVEGAPPPLEPDQEFRFNPASYFEPIVIRLADYPASLHGVIRAFAQQNPGRLTLR